MYPSIAAAALQCKSSTVAGHLAVVPGHESAGNSVCFLQ